MSVKRTKQEAMFRLEIDREYLYGTKDEKKNAWPYDMVIEMLKDPDYGLRQSGAVQGLRQVEGDRHRLHLHQRRCRRKSSVGRERVLQ